jgi:hypothetical protein
MFDPFGVPTVPQVFNRNERPSLGPYCGTLDRRKPSTTGVSSGELRRL